MSDWFNMDDTFECANCGREGDRYTLEEAMRRCGTGYGEWYCIEGDGCNIKQPHNKEVSDERTSM